MLTDKPTDAEIEETIHRTILDLLESSGREVRVFDDDDDLVSTGLTSLDMAALVARLARRWRTDPFLETNSITEVRTVGDFCRVYQTCINGA
jgi:aryl carrier-like protein